MRLLPNYVPLRINLALLKNLKGDFSGAEEDVKAIPNPDANALQMLAYSQTGRGLLSDAAGNVRANARDGTEGRLIGCIRPGRSRDL